MKVWLLMHGDPETSNIHGIYATRELALAAFKAIPFPPEKTPELQHEADPEIYGTDFWHIPHGHELFSETEPEMGWAWDQSWWAKIEEHEVQE